MKSFHKHLLVLSLLLLAAVSVSCTGKLERYINSFNDECPLNAEFGVLTGLNANDKMVQFHYTINDKVVGLRQLESNPALVKKMWKIYFLEDMNQPTRDFINLVISSGRGIQLVFTREQQQFNITINNSELKAMLKSKTPTNEQIDAQLQMSKLTLPKALDQLTTMTDIRLDGDTLTYVYQIKEDALTLDEMPNLRDNIVAGMQKEFASGSALASFFGLIAGSGKCINYQYHGTESKKVIDIVFTNDQLRQIASSDRFK